MRQAIKEIVLFILSSAEIIAEKSGYHPADILTAIAALAEKKYHQKSFNQTSIQSNSLISHCNKCSEKVRGYPEFKRECMMPIHGINHEVKE